MVRSCDPECCCDGDCSANQVRVFSQCLDALEDSRWERTMIKSTIKIHAYMVGPLACCRGGEGENFVFNSQPYHNYLHEELNFHLYS